MTIKMNSGRSIRLGEIHQTHTYSGALLIFSKRRSVNALWVDQLRRGVATRLGMPPVLIQPVSKLLALSPERNPSFQKIDDPEEELPLLYCYGTFDSEPVGNEKVAGSWLPIMWFQDNWAMPIDDRVVEQIKELDWESLAKNWDVS